MKESSLSFHSDKNFTNEQNDKLKTIFDGVLSESATLKKCLECNFSTTSILDFYDTKFHSCIFDNDCYAMKCETCAEMAKDAQSLCLHVDQHKSPVTFLQPVKVRLGNFSCSSEYLSKSCCEIPLSEITETTNSGEEEFEEVSNYTPSIDELLKLPDRSDDGGKTIDDIYKEIAERKRKHEEEMAKIDMNILAVKKRQEERRERTKHNTLLRNRLEVEITE